MLHRSTPALAAILVALMLTGVPPAGRAAAPHDTAAPHPAAAEGDRYVARRVTDRVHVLAQAEPFHLQPMGNVTVVEQETGLILVDAGGSPGSGRQVVELVRAISAKPVTAVIVTHWHGDHHLGASAILEAWPGAELIATPATRANILGPSMAMFPQSADPAADERLRSQILAMADGVTRAAAAPDRPAAVRDGYARTGAELTRYAADMAGVRMIPPGRTFDGRLVLPDAAAPVEVSFLGRANTDGDAVVWLPRQKVLVTGDTVVAPVPFGFGSYPADWLDLIAALKAHDFAHLIPGHGPVQTDASYLDRLTGLITATRARVAAAAADGADLDVVRTRVDLSDQVAVFAGGDDWLRLWFQRYWVDPFVESAFKEVRGLPITQGE